MNKALQGVRTSLSSLSQVNNGKTHFQFIIEISWQVRFEAFWCHFRLRNSLPVLH